MPSFFIHLQATSACTEFVICELVYTTVTSVLRRSLTFNSAEHMNPMQNCMAGGPGESAHVHDSEVARQSFEMGQVTLFWGA